MVEPLSILGAVAGGYVSMAGALYAAQRRLLFPRQAKAPNAVLAKVHDLRPLTLPNDDGHRLTHWYRPAPPGAPLVVAFHGNAGTALDRAEKLAPLLDHGFGLLLAEYRGYAGNPGTPSEDGLVRDAVGLLDWLTGQGTPETRLALYGESLGTGVAVGAAAHRRVGAVVLEAPFTSIAEVAQRRYWYVPAKWLIRDRFESRHRVGEIAAPLLVMHGRRDRIVPLTSGRRLFDAASEPKQFWMASDGGHVDLWDHGAAEVAVPFLRGWLPFAADAVQTCGGVAAPPR